MHFIKLSVWFGLTNVIVLMTVSFIIANVKSITFIDIILSFFSGILSSILVAGILPIFENLFNIVTSMKLLELINPEHPLLRKLVVEAPGTYNHSLMVANLSEILLVMQLEQTRYLQGFLLIITILVRRGDHISLKKIR